MGERLGLSNVGAFAFQSGDDLRMLYGTVSSVSPFTVTVDGDDTAVAVTPCVATEAGARVVMLASRRARTLLAVGVVGGGCPHRVGQYFLTETNEDPNDLWPGTTWVELAGRVLVGRDTAQTEFDVVGEEGGHKAPAAHSHNIGVAGAGANGSPYGNFVVASFNNNVATTTTGTGDSGNLQPYRVCYIWRRTA